MLLLKSEKKRELVTFFREQAKLEEEIVKSVNKALKKLKNPVVISVLKGMSLDSLKHADLYKAAESVVSVAPAISEDELDHLNEVVTWHIENEEKIMKRLEDAKNKISDKKIKLLLEIIAADERRHHELLKTIMDNVVHGETITEDEWWEMIYRNAPFHGAPGG